MSFTTKVKVAKFSEKSYNKTVIDFNFGRHKDLSTLKGDIITFSGRYILMSPSLKSIIVYCYMTGENPVS